MTSLLMRGSLGTASPKTRPASPSPALTLLPITYLVATFRRAVHTSFLGSLGWEQD